MNPIAHNLRAMRTAAGLTQPQLAEKAGIEQGYLSKLENGRATPSSDVLERLAAALGVAVERLTTSPATPRRTGAMLAFGTLFGIGAIVVGIVLATPERAPPPMVAAGAPLSLSLALDLAPDSVAVRDLLGGEPGRMLSVRGVADDERAVRAYLSELERFGRVHGIDIDPQPWWRFGAVNFTINVLVHETQGGDAGTVNVYPHSDDPREARGVEQVRRLLAGYDLRPWLFTHEIVVQSRVIPHSHPVLTVGPQYLDDDHRQLATLVHEQIHWFADWNRKPEVRAAMRALEQRYPHVPVGQPDGARDRDSGYLHLIVCWLELDAMTRLVGADAARRVLSEKDYYRWIYARVLDDTDAIGEVLARHGLLIDR